MLDRFGPGDTVVVWKLDRLARSARDLLTAMDTFNEAGGKLQSLSEPWANTTSHAGQMIVTVFAGMAGFERDLIRERTGAGREAVCQRGVRFGRPRKLNPDQARLACQLVAEGKAVRRSPEPSMFMKLRSTVWLLLPDGLRVSEAAERSGEQVLPERTAILKRQVASR